jgi:cytochrome c-type biogenesis protein CcmF
MNPELGHYALILAFVVALLQSTIPLIGARSRDFVLMRVGDMTAFVQFVCVAFSFAVLVSAYVQSDFSVAVVAENSHTQMPLIYKFTSVWGNHEGSMLLWVLILALFSGMVAAFGGNLPATLKATVLAVQSWIAALFYLFILVTSNPFLRLSPAPVEGRDLNPILQDPGLAIHPPLLYVGYVGFSISFSFALAALIQGRIDAAWARFARPWILIAWIFLTLGIAMGSYWAYYTLGWGGFWFWDPVENASLLPWLAGTALLHSALVMEKREALKVWTILLAILTFSMSLIGTFLVRSGVLTSVHSFASDPTRGVFILAILVLLIGGALIAYAWRAPLLKKGGLFAPVSREGSLVFNNLFLSTCCATVFVGTLYPLALEGLTGAKISVGAPFFNTTIGPLFVPILLAMGYGPLLAWKRGNLLTATQRLLAAFLLAAVGAGIAAALRGNDAVAILGVALCIFVIVASVVELLERVGVFRVPLTTVAHRAIGLSRSAWGTMFAHAGLGLSALGIVCAASWGTEQIIALKPGATLDISGYTLRFERTAVRPGSNYQELTARFSVHNGDRLVGIMEPTKRSFGARATTVNQPALMSVGFSQIYLATGDMDGDGTLAVRAYFRPLVLLIWLGALVMGFGGALSLSDRRLRVGLPKLARTRLAAEPAE